MKDNKIIDIIFVVYSILMCILLFLRPMYNPGSSYVDILSNNINIIPFFTIKSYIRLLMNTSSLYYIKSAIINLLGNIVLFIPLGIFLPYLFPKFKKINYFLIVFTIIIVIIELIQLFTLTGSLDIDDYILNLCGGLIGYGLFKLAK